MIKAWHFVGATLRDGRPIPKDGEWLVHTGPVEICATGLHASARPWHALQYAPGSVLCRVECDDVLDEHDDKFVCRRRRIIERADITETLRYYARMQALSVIHFYDDPADVVLDYLMTGDESIRDAAWTASATWAAAFSQRAARAARIANAACDESAVWAVRAAARAAGDAVLNAAWGAPWAACDAWDADGHEFDALIYEQFGVAA